MNLAITILLALLVIGVAWAVLEVRKLNDSIGPVANSAIVRTLSGIGSGV